MYDSLIRFIREYFRTTEFIPLHAPVFSGNEKEYVNATLESTFVSSVGAFVDQFENRMAAFTGSERAVATVNGTAALHMALLLSDVRPGDLVITQSLTFVATCNAIAYCGAEPVFVDVDLHTMGLSSIAMESWLSQNAYRDSDGKCRAKSNDKFIKACLPMHTFGHPVELDALVECCARWGLTLVEDAAESLGSFYKGRHTGTFGALGTLSFNGNKIITTGGGGMILTNAQIGVRAKHLTTTAKLSHAYEFRHDEVGYNYRLPNLNAALGCAQLEMLSKFIAAKRLLAECYERELVGSGLEFFKEPENCRSNYWLNAVVCENSQHRDELLQATNSQSVMTRPIWTLMNKLPAYADCLRGDLSNSEWLEARVVNLPSSVVLSSIV
jgi:aminotransferase in exopolysaccharide biosynthesis